MLVHLEIRQVYKSIDSSVKISWLLINCIQEFRIWPVIIGQERFNVSMQH
jgi:hypothetical protein